MLATTLHALHVVCSMVAGFKFELPSFATRQNKYIAILSSQGHVHTAQTAQRSTQEKPKLRLMPDNVQLQEHSALEQHNINVGHPKLGQRYPPSNRTLVRVPNQLSNVS